MGVETYLIHECVIMEKTNSQDSVGGDVGSWTEISGSNYLGYIGSPGKDERMQSGIETVFATNKHIYPVEVELTRMNRIKCLHADFLNQVFEVLPLRNVWGNHKKASLRLVN